MANGGVTRAALGWVEQGLVPDRVVRAAIRRLCEARLADIDAGDCEQSAAAAERFIDSMDRAPIALLPERANEQHYEVPRDTMRFGLSKAFHVSPFMPMDMDYDWRFSTPGDSLARHTANLRCGRRVFDATLMLRRHEISGHTLAATLLHQPLGSLAVVGRIYWQALRLWAKRVPFHVHPTKRSLEKAA